MALLEIEATFTCDGCGKKLKCDLDPAYKPPPDWSLFDAAEDAMRGGGGYLLASVQGSHHLCTTCTAWVDEKTGENPSREEVAKALEYLPPPTDKEVSSKP